MRFELFIAARYLRARRQQAVVGLALALALPALAQAPRSTPVETGTVSGHILCGDTQRPARMAEVRLVPTSVTPAASNAKANDASDNAAPGNQTPPVQTDLDGAYVVRNVKPGTYFLRVDYVGYVTPILSFTRDQLSRPTPGERQRIERDLQVITVSPNATAQGDATILRGAAISGTVLYDDGSPAVNVSVQLLRRDNKGDFKAPYNADTFLSSTDDRGHFRIDALPADDFVLRANFSLSEASVMSMPLPNGGSGTMEVTINKVLFSLPLYSGSVLRRHDAAVIKTDAGQEAPPVDLTLPLAKLHSVSGSVLAPDGHPVTSGRVALLYADTREELTNVPISRDDNQFHFLYVPEGAYILSVEKAEDITQIEVPNARGVTPAFHTEDKTVRTYGTVEQPLQVQSEVSSVLATVPNASRTSATAASAPDGAKVP